MPLIWDDTRKELWIYLLLFTFSMGCGGKGSESPPIIRLVDPSRIVSVNSTFKEVLEGNSILLDMKPPLMVLDSRSEWHPFSIAKEMGNTQGAELDSQDPPSFLEKNKSDLLIPQGMGVAYIIPVEPDSQVFIECEGRFDPASKCSVTAAQLTSCPKFQPLGKPGLVREYLNSANNLGEGLLKPSKNGLSASRLLKINDKTRSILMTVIANGNTPGLLRRLRLTDVTVVSNYLYKRKESGIVHPAIMNTPFIEATVRPSILLFPETSVSWKAFEIPENAEFRCALCLVEENPNPVKITLTGMDRDGGTHEIFQKELKGNSKRWIELKAELSFLSGCEVAFTLNCFYASGGRPDTVTQPPMVCCGAPAVYSENQGLNLILISLDTLRHDRLGCYGYEQPVSPTMDLFAKEGFQFMNFYAQAPYTLPSHASLFSSLYPTVHGMHDFRGRMTEGITLLAERLAEHGLATASFNNGGFVSHEFGFHRGFDLYCEVDPIGHWYLMGRSPDNPNRLADGSPGSLDKALTWLREVKGKRFFLFLHTFMIHDYLPPKDLAMHFNENCPSRLRPAEKNCRLINHEYVKEHGISRDDLAHFVNMYDATVKAADNMVGKVLSQLEELGLLDTTIVVITSDHGEEFMEHGSVQHGKSVYDEVIHVPLLMHVPGMEGGKKVDTFINQVDVMPTLLEIMGIPPVKGMQGHSFLPLMKGREGKDRIIFGEVQLPKRTFRHCIIVDGWKYVEGRIDSSLVFPALNPVEFFELKTDHREQHNLLNEYPDKADQYKAMMDRFRADLERTRHALTTGTGKSISLSDDLLDALHQQGYF